MPGPVYVTSQDAETAFYAALENADLDAMMAVWADDDDIVCVHPGAVRLRGVEAVRESWRRIFASGQRLSFQLQDVHRARGVMVTVHSLLERVSVAGESQPRSLVVATNVYQQTERGWRLIVHHASPAPANVRREPAQKSATLH